MNTGDVLVGVGNGQINRFSSTGVLLNTLDTTTGSYDDTGMCFDAHGNLFATDFQANTVSTFDNAGNLLQSTWGSGYNSDPESCVVDSSGHIYVGQADGSAQILEFDASGNLLAAFSPTTEYRGTDWIDLASDQCTIFYTSEGSGIHRFNVCTNTQLSDFATGLPSPCYALRIRSNGEVMVACASALYRLDATGNIIQSYPGANYGENSFFAMNLDPDGTSVWSAGYNSGMVYKIDITSGSLLFSFAANPNTDIAGLAIVGETSAQIPVGPQGSQRYGGANPSMPTVRRPCVCDPVDSYSGNFYHTFSDFAVPGRGIPLQFTHTYNAGAASQNGPLGYGWSGSYNASLSVDATTGDITITQENGSTVTFTPNGSSGFTSMLGVLATLVHNNDGTYTFTRIQDQTHYTFSAGGQLMSETDRNGYVTTFAYNGSSQLTTVTDAAGRTLTFTYDGSGHINKVTDPLGRTVSFTYDANGNLASQTDVGGGVTSFTYDANHLLLSMTDPRGGITTNTYDSSGRVVQQTDPLGRITTLSYTSSSNGSSNTTITDPNGNVTLDYFYNGLLVAETKGYGTSQAATWGYTYDPISLGQATITDPNGNLTSQTWDASGNLLSSTDPLGRTTSYTYDALNDVTSVTDPLGSTTTYTYDAHGNLLSSSRPLLGTNTSQTTTYTYGDSAHPGDITAMTDPNGKVWHYAYDAQGDRTSSSDPLGDTTTATYNADGWKTAETSPRGNTNGATPSQFTTTYTYDAFGDLTQTTDPLGGVTKRQYDADRNLIAATDADGNTTQYTYDLDNERTTTTRADGTTLSASYDANGNQTGQTDGLGHTTSYSYDALNQPVAMTDPLNRTTSYTYDPAGNRTTLTDPSGNVTTYAYDAANELTSITYSDGITPSVSYSYDADGRRVSMTDGTGTTTSTYDSLGRLTSSTNGAGASVAYAYDLAGQLTALTYPNGKTVSRAYDAAGRLSSVSDWLGNTSTFGYDADGNLVRSWSPNGVVGLFVYDHADRLSNDHYAAITGGSTGTPPQTGTVLFNVSYPRDALGQLRAQQASAGVQSGIQMSSETYTYSSLNQLGGVTPAGSSTTSYTYDAAGNLTQRGAATLSYDAADQLTSLTQGTTVSSFTYDGQGNRTQVTLSTGGPSTSYTYDQANRLTGYTSGSTSATYAYNGDGLRMSKTVGGSGSPTESFAWDVSGSLPLLLTDGATSFIYGPGGLPLEQLSAGGPLLYFAHDQLGSTRLLTTAKGQVAATYSYDAYGAVTAQTGTASTTPLQFAGQYSDVESGLLYLRARYYDPATAQFLSRDPLVALTAAAYAYAGDNPLNALDPSGLDWFSTALDYAGIGVEAVGLVALGVAAVAAAPEIVAAAGTVAVGSLVVGTAISVGSTAYTYYQYTQGNASLQDLSVSALGTAVGFIPGVGDTVTMSVQAAQFGYDVQNGGDQSNLQGNAPSGALQNSASGTGCPYANLQY